MKRVFSLALAIVLVLSLAPSCFAEFDLSGMSYDDLVALKDQVQRAIWENEKWEEVTVPQGIYQVGRQIPPGKWTVLCKSNSMGEIEVADSLRENGTKVTFPPKASKVIYNPDGLMYNEGDATEWTVELFDGEYVAVSMSSLVFTPYSGAPELGFK
jgi:hypothetical protein